MLRNSFHDSHLWYIQDHQSKKIGQLNLKDNTMKLKLFQQKHVYRFNNKPLYQNHRFHYKCYHPKTHEVQIISLDDQYHQTTSSDHPFKWRSLIITLNQKKIAYHFRLIPDTYLTSH